MLRILQVVPFFYPAYAFGGPVRSVYFMSKELVKRGHKVTVFTSDAKDLTARLNIERLKLLDGMRVFYFRNLSLKLIKWLRLFITPELVLRAWEEVKGGKFDIIHLNGYRTFQNVVVGYYAHKYRVPYVLQARGSLPRKVIKQRLKHLYDVFFGHKLLKNASRVIALSKYEAKQYMDMGISKEKIEILPNGIPLSQYFDLPSKGSFKERIGIDKDKKIILYLGRINKIKGIDFLVKTYAYLIKKFKLDNTVLVIAGPDDGYLSELSSLISCLGVDNRILLTGPLYGRVKLEAYVDATICAYLNPYEPFGLVPLEAAACKTPVVVSAGTYMGEVVKKGGFGFSVKYGSIKSLSDVFLRVLSDERLVEDLGETGRKYVFKNFSWDKVVEKLEKVYEEVVNQG